MRIIYALRDNPLRNAQEVRYSLRSLARQGYDGMAMVCGHRPKWYSGRHVHERDILGNHQLNMTHKLALAMNSGGPEVVWMCDDYYLLGPLDLRHHHGLPLRKTVENLQRARHEREWTRLMMEETLQYLLGQGVKEPLNYVTHTPFFMEKGEARLAMSICLTSRTGMELATIYGNLFGSGHEKVFHEDVKIRSEHGMRNINPEWGSFSSDPSVEDSDAFRDVMESLYPEPSDCEEDMA
jgi:hypothetical protein